MLAAEGKGQEEEWVQMWPSAAMKRRRRKVTAALHRAHTQHQALGFAFLLVNPHHDSVAYRGDNQGSEGRREASSVTLLEAEMQHGSPECKPVYLCPSS